MAAPLNLTTGVVYLQNNIAGSSITVGGSTPSSALAATTTTKLTTGLADATATTVFTINCPNTSLAAFIHVEAIGSLGAGGAVGAFEASILGSFDICITRVAGVAAISTGASLYGTTSSASVAGATTIAMARSFVAWSGAVGATNTQAVQMTLTKGGGASTNHQLTLLITVVNTVANGVTIS